MSNIKKEDLETRLREIQDRFTKDSFNYTAAPTISKIYIGGYLEALFNFGLITSEELDEMIKEWVW